MPPRWSYPRRERRSACELTRQPRTLRFTKDKRRAKSEFHITMRCSLSKGSVMARDQDRNEQFEWVNAWAEATKVQTPSALKPEAVVSAAPGNASDVTAQDSVAAVAQTAADDQLTRDI